jgi:hypothetical protein
MGLTCSSFPPSFCKTTSLTKIVLSSFKSSTYDAYSTHDFFTSNPTSHIFFSIDDLVILLHDYLQSLECVNDIFALGASLRLNNRQMIQHLLKNSPYIPKYDHHLYHQLVFYGLCAPDQYDWRYHYVPYHILRDKITESQAKLIIESLPPPYQKLFIAAQFFNQHPRKPWFHLYPPYLENPDSLPLSKNCYENRQEYIFDEIPQDSPKKTAPMPIFYDIVLAYRRLYTSANHKDFPIVSHFRFRDALIEAMFEIERHYQLTPHERIIKLVRDALTELSKIQEFDHKLTPILTINDLMNSL